MRLQTTAAVAATTALGAVAAAAAAGRYAANAALRPARTRRGRPPVPAGFAGPPLTVHSFTHWSPGTAEEAGGDAPEGNPGPGHAGDAGRAGDTGHIALTRSFTAQLPGTYGLSGRGCHAVVGPVLDEPPEDTAADTAVRRLDRITYGDLKPGTRVRLTPLVHVGDPHEALGIDHVEVDIPGESGALPGWFVPGHRDTWVITVHGLGATLDQALNVLPFLHGQQLPVLALSYRGDLGAPSPSNGVGHLGDSEWRDVDAALRYAVRYGADRIVLYGWSTGAYMALRAAANSALRQHVSGLVLDSPVLDRRATLRALAVARGTPRALLPLAVRAAEGRVGLRSERQPGEQPGELPPYHGQETHTGPERPAVPTLLFHGPDDTIAPWAYSRELASRHPHLVSAHTVPHARHAAMWNADPAAYEEALRRFLTSVM
ncbi:alpha/beta hydrolase [Streptomyces armeniacus]|uniref:Alpha/beta hydrolase n=1 Tax=Streptomyces armeniacus TaxID=83291 RepID=A0A345XRD7_9ACTN|nr:alpha/beta hydrolase [Streptomyces armeniacus]AXK34203.1 alpha/beta hydrolase [Streptomyces armeniacus]